ncbi:Hypothetical_protein [Hexamita inflata]|uniref:Hypothetical_protein n=1 Tax=Hexamita inflata TaxID=28002 RepID=A0AA86Q907_9EUKA|nr:Hypothetical protein HINF_LOCUS41173 [Hexamita inflata]
MQQFKEFAIKVSKLDPKVIEYNIRQAIAPRSRAALSLLDGVARIRDFSPEIVDLLKAAFPNALVEKIPRLESKDRAFFQSQIRLQQQVFTNWHPAATNAFVIVKSTSEQSFLTENALKFATEIFQCVPFEKAKIITSHKHLSQMSEQKFMNASGQQVQTEVFLNESKDTVSFKFIQIKGWVSSSKLDDTVAKLCKLDTIPDVMIFEHERKKDNVE